MSHDTKSPQSEEKGPAVVAADFTASEWPMILDLDPDPSDDSPPMPGPIDRK